MPTRRLGIRGLAQLAALVAAVLLPTATFAQGTMWHAPVPTPLLIPPGLHAQFLAQPASTTKLDGATFAYGAFWTVTTGYPATLEEVLPSGAVAVKRTLAGAYGAWAVSPGPNDTIWVGTYHGGVVFAYSLKSRTVRRVGRIPGANTVWSLAYDPLSGLMWASSFPNGIWTIAPATGRMRRVATVPGEAGARTIAFVDGRVLGGTYPSMDVLSLSLPGLPGLLGNLESLLGGSGQVAREGSYRGHVVVLGDNGQLVWIGAVRGAALGYQTLSDCESLPFSFDGRTVVLRRDRIVPIDPGVAGRYNAVNLPIVGSALASLPAGMSWSAYGTVQGTLYALASNGTLVRVLRSGAVSTSRPSLTAQPGIIQAMAYTPWGVFGSSYLGGQVWRYAGGAFTSFGGIDQVDSIVPCGGSVFLGVYPGGYLYVFNPSAAWDPPLNPRRVGSAGTAQDRVPGIACVDGTAYIGTVPQGSALGGAIYSSAHRTYRSPVADETPVSLGADGSLVVGALSNQNALGTPAPALDAHLFALNPESGKSVVVDLHSRQTFAGVLTWHGSVYAASPQFLVRWNPTTDSLAEAKIADKVTGYTTNWGFTTHLFGIDGRLYLIDNGWLYLVDPTTLRVTRLFYGVQHAASDGRYVYFSFYRSQWLVRLPAVDLTSSAARWPWNFWYDWRHDGHVWPPPKA